MSVLKVTVYGFADPVEVEEFIRKRLSETSADKKEETAALLGEAIAAIIEINDVIPVHHKSRHLVANALERFAGGPTS